MAMQTVFALESNFNLLMVSRMLTVTSQSCCNHSGLIMDGYVLLTSTAWFVVARVNVKNTHQSMINPVNLIIVVDSHADWTAVPCTLKCNNKEFYVKYSNSCSSSIFTNKLLPCIYKLISHNFTAHHIISFEYNTHMNRNCPGLLEF